MKVIIIGAGIAGLVQAACLQRAGHEVRVYEAAKQLRTIGGGLFLWPHALRFLEEMGLRDCLRPAQMSVQAMNIVSHDGKVLCSEKFAALNAKLDGEILPIDRSVLQHMLASQLDERVLELNKQCIDIEMHSTGARVSFKDGTVESADLVIGADGIHSVIRQYVHANKKPVYSGFCWWGGLIDGEQVPHFPVDHVQYILGINKLCSIWPTHGHRFMWYLPVKMALKDFNAESDGVAEAQSLCAGWSDDVIRIINAPQSAQRFHLPIYEVPPSTANSRDSVVLIGDAACVSGPLLGQGANKAIEDAYLLMLCLQQQPNAVSAALMCYDALRYQRHQRFDELEHLSADALMQENKQALQHFEMHIPHIKLVDMYQDIIPLVNAKACAALQAEATRKKIKKKIEETV